MFRRTWSSKQHTLWRFKTPIAPQEILTHWVCLVIFNGGTFFSYNGSNELGGKPAGAEASRTASAWTLTLETLPWGTLPKPTRPRGCWEGFMGRHLAGDVGHSQREGSPAGTYSACLKALKVNKEQGVGRGTRLSNSNTTSSTQDPA